MSATNVTRSGKRGNICVGNNVSATMCPRLPGPLRVSNCTFFIFDSELQDSLSFGFPEYSVRSEMMTYLSEHQNST